MNTEKELTESKNKDLSTIDDNCVLIERKFDIKDSVYVMHRNAFAYIFDNLGKNYIKLFMFSILTVVALLVPILIPLILLSSWTFFGSIVEKGEADFNYTLCKLNMTTDRYLNLLLAFSVALVIIVSGYVVFVIPGIIMALALSPLFYVLAVNEDITLSDSIFKSINMMKGNKIKFLLLNLFGAIVPFLMFLIILIISPFEGLTLFTILIFMFAAPVIYAEIYVSKYIFFKGIYVSLD